MARRRRVEESGSHERWLISYADFITLLFAFFVVMYAISSVNEGKYRVLSESLVEAFTFSASPITPIQTETLSRPNGTGLLDGAAVISGRSDAFASSHGHAEDSGAIPDSDSLGYMMGEIARTLSTYIDQELIDVTRGEASIQVEIRSSLLFQSGSARLSRQALEVLKKIVAILKPLPNSIQAKGYTDNVPINTVMYPSNWELSAARAAGMVRLFSRYGIDPRRLSATGYGEFSPIADNTTEEGRNKNRRVVLMIETVPVLEHNSEQ